ncbi:hypothetical protein V5735_22975 (plasmid) [Haladaptatus sp. SPP-AMP-3]|uniref:hypothetical protein n=1 Tax=Haladaptatus sp. SPP-AMP-3 TaxID=3121295 RepID=UPI003C30767F
MDPNQTAGGKAILSRPPEEEVRASTDSAGLPGKTQNTVTTDRADGGTRNRS